MTHTHTHSILRESITKILVFPFQIRIWRQEEDLTTPTSLLKNDDLFAIACEVVKEDGANSLVVSKQLLLLLERVNAVEVIMLNQIPVQYSGGARPIQCVMETGEVLYKDWP